jgi:3-ketosteroid 9alpha-monooxygenase subunit A
MGDIREIDTGAPMTRLTRGWHCPGLAEDFPDGQPHGIDEFGTKLVVFADSDGAPKALDGYCRYLGGDLSQGTVKGDAVACPFHDWRWGVSDIWHREVEDNLRQRALAKEASR